MWQYAEWVQILQIRCFLLKRSPRSVWTLNIRNNESYHFLLFQAVTYNTQHNCPEILCIHTLAAQLRQNDSTFARASGFVHARCQCSSIKSVQSMGRCLPLWQPCSRAEMCGPSHPSHSRCGIAASYQRMHPPQVRRAYAAASHDRQPGCPQHWGILSPLRIWDSSCACQFCKLGSWVDHLKCIRCAERSSWRGPTSYSV